MKEDEGAGKAGEKLDAAGAIMDAVEDGSFNDLAHAPERVVQRFKEAIELAQENDLLDNKNFRKQLVAGFKNVRDFCRGRRKNHHVVLADGIDINFDACKNVDQFIDEVIDVDASDDADDEE